MIAHLDLFSGIGGFALACQWAGIETIGFVEIDKYCQKVLRKHFPGVPIVEDIRDVEKIKEIIANTRCQYDEGQLFKREYEETVCKGATTPSKRPNSTPRNCVSDRERTESPAILVTAGFPCQPFSVAGKRQGEGDDRYLWPETLAVIEAVKPEWVLLENVTGIKSVYQSDMLSELEARKYNTEEEATADFSGVLEREATNILWLVLEGLRGAGYEVEVLVIPACAVNAWHRRDRVWIIANNQSLFSNGSNNDTRISVGRKSLSESGNCDRSAIIPFTKSRKSRQQTEQKGREDTGRGSEEVSIHNSMPGRHTLSEREISTRGNSVINPDWWAVEPELGRVAHGIPALSLIHI